jgi:hypothetical protein
MDLTDIYRIFHPIAAECAFFSEAHGIFFKIDYILGQSQVLTNTKN